MIDTLKEENYEKIKFTKPKRCEIFETSSS